MVTGALEFLATELMSGDADERIVTRIFDDVKKELTRRLCIPSATYRLQFNRFFTFRQAREQADYLHRLGISHIYASPYFRARAESLHGYDIANHNELNPSVGTEDDLVALVAALREHDMGHILDTVPNHMGVGEQSNLWWLDVLENGRLGALFANEDHGSLAKTLLAVLEDQAREARADLARREVRRYDWSVVAPQVVRVYETVLGGGSVG